MNIDTHDLSSEVSDTRLDTLLMVFNEVQRGKGKVLLSFQNTKSISPAGIALLCNLIDASSESTAGLDFEDFKEEDTRQMTLKKLLEESKRSEGFIEIKKFQFEDKDSISWAKVSSIAPEFIERLASKFGALLGEEKLWCVQLILNELMQNAVDHSTSERYFIYAGVNGDDFEFGVLDRGVSIPAKLFIKFSEEDDTAYVEKSLEKGVGTRRNREGGMGLYYMFENVKDQAGKIVITSREGQVRRHFNSRVVRRNKTKRPLLGTWCMARIPLEKKK